MFLMIVLWVNTMSKLTVLVIDDEADIRELITITLSEMGFICEQAETVTQAKAILEQGNINICLTDMRLPDGDGLALVDYIEREYSHIPVAVITAFGSMESAIAALKRGAFDFVNKPVNIKILRQLMRAAEKQIGTDKNDVMQAGNAHRLIGQSKPIDEVKSMIRRVAKSQAPVMILGASGTGKELVARMIHEQSGRRSKKFVPINCGAIPHELMESEFFGHKKGSFTGATENKPGLFQAADGGTLFLDEIAELPLHMQVKLLRAIQEKSIKPIGEQQETMVDVRIVSATHKDLNTLLEQNQFRQDLFYRINVIGIKMPTLSSHTEDIPLLAEHILKKISKELHIQQPKLEANALKVLETYNFPGNVRELENILARAATLCENNIITANDLHLDEVSSIPKSADSTQLNTHLDAVEKQMIMNALDANKWNKEQTAKQLGLTLRALRYRLKKLQID